jgi:hypothetical protein
MISLFFDLTFIFAVVPPSLPRDLSFFLQHNCAQHTDVPARDAATDDRGTEFDLQG